LRAVPSIPDRLEIRLAGMRFHLLAGILPHERELPQPLEVDLTVRRTPGVAAVLDYRTLYALTRDALHAAPVEYLETVAATIADAALALAGVDSVRVAVRKPHVMLDGPLDVAEIVLERHRG
jgi:dihydroneopterin aldolase